jgi:hypothetical protein
MGMSVMQLVQGVIEKMLRVVIKDVVSIIFETETI